MKSNRPAIPMVNVEIIQERKERPLMRIRVEPAQHLSIYFRRPLANALRPAWSRALVVFIEQRLPSQPAN